MKNNTIRYAYYSMPGLVRLHHEDNLYIDGNSLERINSGTEQIITGTIKCSEGAVAGVFDGMGGEAAGETAAYLAARRMHESCGGPLAGELRGLCGSAEQERFLDQLCQDMNESVCRYASEHHIRSMGSTAAYILFGRECISCANVGDSRIYRFRGSEMKQLSVDHVRRSFLGRKGALTQFLGVEPEEMVLQPHVESDDYVDGTCYLLCTDGVTDMLSATVIRELVAPAGRMAPDAGLYAVIEKMRAGILENGARDNATIMLLQV